MPDTEFISYLPDGVGMPLRRRLERAEALRAEADEVMVRARREARELRREATRDERAVLAAVRKEWTADEIAEARRAAREESGG